MTKDFTIPAVKIKLWHVYIIDIILWPKILWVRIDLFILKLFFVCTGCHNPTSNGAIVVDTS